MIFIGVDPGKTGAMAAMSEHHTFVKVWCYGDQEIDYFLKHSHAECRALIEKAQPFPKDSKPGAFKYGMNYGGWLRLFEFLKIPCDIVTPRQWQKAMFDAASTTGMNTKEISLARAKRIFPQIPLPFKKDHGKSDALLLAELCRRRFLKGNDGI